MTAVLDSSKRLPKLVIIGLGLIGGSLAVAYKNKINQTQKNKREIIAVVRSKKTADYAIEHNIVDRVCFSINEIANELTDGDIIFIAVPTLSVAETIKAIKTVVSENVTITDGASVKGTILESIKAIYGQVPPQFILGHPIAGSEKSGVSASNPDLYINHRVILTPVEETNATHLKNVIDMWELVGAEVLTMSVEEHDSVLAATSHLPHAIAYSLVDTLANDSENENIFRYAAGGFRDFTRIASSDPTMWHDIMCANREAVLEALDLFQNNLSQLRKAIDQKDSEKLLTIFSRAKIARDEFSSLITQTLNKK